MGNVKKIIKKLLVEVAGISFEVRKWSNIIGNYVDNVYAEEKKKLEKESNDKPQQSKSWGSTTPSYNDFDYDASLGFTHFQHDKDADVHEYDRIVDEAYLYADELQVTPDARHECPNIDKAISGILLKITLDGVGGIDVESAQGSKLDDSFIDCVIELVEDHMVSGQDFYDMSYNTLHAMREDEEDFGWTFPKYDSKNKKWWEIDRSSYGGYGGYSGYKRLIPDIKKIEINGKDYPEAYKDFSVDKWVIEDSYRTEYDHWKSGYNDEGEYIVYLNMSIGPNFGGSALTHEIKHAYDDWNRMRHGGKPIRDSWEIQNIYTKDFEKLVLGAGRDLNQALTSIIRYYYLGSNLETPAYLENEYDNVSFMGNYRETAKKLMNFKAKNYMKENGEPAKGLQESWEKLIKEFDIPLFRKFKNVINFLEYTEKYFNKRGRNILKRIDKMRYVHDKPEPKPVVGKWKSKSWDDYKKEIENNRKDNNRKDNNQNQLKLPF